MTISKAQQRAVAKYNKTHYKRVAVLFNFQQKEEIQTAASKAGETMSTYIKKATIERMEREKDD